MTSCAFGRIFFIYLQITFKNPAEFYFNRLFFDVTFLEFC